jgi:hypothetical protein
LGPQAGLDANTRFAAFASGVDGPKANPASEAIVTAPFVDPTGSGGHPFDDLLRVTANDVTIDGFVLDGWRRIDSKPCQPTAEFLWRTYFGWNFDPDRGIEKRLGFGTLDLTNWAQQPILQAKLSVAGGYRFA